jgi:hypothetical protein
MPAGFLPPRNAGEGCPPPGRCRCRSPGHTCGVVAPLALRLVALRCHCNLSGHRPPKAHQCTGDRDDDLMGIVSAGPQASEALTPAHVRLAAAVLDRRGEMRQPEWPVATDVGGIATGLRPFHQGATGLGMTSVGTGTGSAARTAGVCRRDQPHACHQMPGGLDACLVAPCNHRGHSHGALDAPPGLERCDDGRYEPGVALVWACLCETCQACRRCGDGAALGLKDHVRCRGQTDHRSAPPEVGRPPGGSTRVATVLAKPAGLETARRRLEVRPGLFAGAGESAQRVRLPGRARHGGERPRAPQSAQWDGVTTVEFYPVARLLGHAGGRAAVAPMAWWRPRPLAPGPARSRCVDQDQRCGLGVQRAPAWVPIGWPGAKRAEDGDGSVVRLGPVSHSAGRLRPSHADGDRARR